VRPLSHLISPISNVNEQNKTTFIVQTDATNIKVEKRSAGNNEPTKLKDLIKYSEKRLWRSRTTVVTVSQN
jgi:hypothetical protein